MGLERRRGAQEVAIQLSDALGLIQNVRYSLDAGAWVLILPTDGVSDSAEESCRIQLDRHGPLSRCPGPAPRPPLGFGPLRPARCGHGTGRVK